MERTGKAWINAILFAVTLAVNTMGALGAETWAVIMLAVAVALVIPVMLKLRNAAFPLPAAGK